MKGNPYCKACRINLSHSGDFFFLSVKQILLVKRGTKSIIQSTKQNTSAIIFYRRIREVLHCHFCVRATKTTQQHHPVCDSARSSGHTPLRVNLCSQSVLCFNKKTLCSSFYQLMWRHVKAFYC